MRDLITVTGAINPMDLGFCHCHEHIALRKGKSYEVNKDLCIDDIEKSLEELKRFKSLGGCTLLEAQPCGCCRMAKELKILSEQSGVNIIASTGFHKMIFYPDTHWIHTISEKNLEDLFVEELENGMYLDADDAYPKQQSSIRAGYLKTALDTENLSPRYRRLFEAAGKAAIRTDRIIMVHVEKGSNPLKLQAFLTDLGVKASNIMFCHMDRACSDLTVHEEILKNGSFAEYDTIGRFKYHSDEYEVEIIKHMIAAGFKEQLLYSLDTTRARLKSYTPGAVGLDYILTTFNPLLERSGVNPEIINLLSRQNPLRFLTT